ncbi:LLM class flavin-dependent oxidoreductase [Streptomyces sp. NPDC057582]|uniref:LLM class flavin-dependent oxidoreductase n=1 Tax=Streptomyces sp. NPDC057582 TaxID=3346174 RepID=UPI0036C07244
MGYDSLWTGDRVLAPLVPGAPYPSADGEMPIMLARSLTTLDLLSQGRLTVGLGLGWMPDEYTAVSVPSRLRRVRVLGTVPIPPAISRRPREEEGQEASGTGEGPEAAE